MFIQLFVPPVYYKVKNRLFPKPEPERHPLPKIECQGDRMIVVGNGPSLNKTMELYGDIVCNTPCMMVNFSANTDMFTRIKPSVYLLTDPAYYTLPDNLRESILALFDAIVSKTTWPMTIIMSIKATKSYATERFADNDNLKVLFYEDGWYMPKNMSKFEAWDKNLISPPGQTVMNTAIWLSIYWNNTETYIIGADSTFLHDMYVGQKDNVVYTIDTHFYKNEDVYHEEFEPQRNGRPFGMDMEQLLDAVHTMYVDYKTLKAYAEWKDVKVYNASEYSMIDCFERKKLNE